MNDKFAMSQMRNEQAEAMYWRFKALTDHTQTSTPASERDAFKRVVMDALAERDQVKAALR
jgi:hypothetical protein